MLADSKRRAIWIGGLLACALLVFFGRLGEAPVFMVNEAREGVYVRAMFDTGDFILPQVPNHVESGETIPDKPPLFHWIAAGATVARAVLETGRVPSGSELSRQVDEWTLRFPSALCAILTVLGVALLGCGLIGERAAFLAAASLLLTFQFVHQARYGRVDMVFTCFVTYAMLFAARALTKQSGRALLLAAAASGLAALAKGPLGIVLPAVASGAWMALESVRRRSIRWLRPLPWRSAGLVLALVVLPWYVAAYASGGMAFVRSQLLTENLRQFLGGNSRMGPFYYVSAWLTDTFPWNFLALAGLFQVWRRRDEGAEICAVWWLSFLLLFELAAYKRRAYLLPAMPGGAMLAGCWLASKLPHRVDASLERIRTQLRGWLSPSFGAALLAGAVGAPLLLRQLFPAPAGAAGHPVELALAAGGGALLIAAGRELLQGLRARRAPRAIGALYVALAAAYLGLGIVPRWEIARAARHPAKQLVQRVVRELPEGQRLTVRGVGDDPSLLFLLYFPDSEKITVTPERETAPADSPPGFYVLSRKEWSRVRSRSPETASGWRVLRQDVLPQSDGDIPIVLAERRSVTPARTEKVAMGSDSSANPHSGAKEDGSGGRESY